MGMVLTVEIINNFGGNPLFDYIPIFEPFFAEKDIIKNSILTSRGHVHHGNSWLHMDTCWSRILDGLLIIVIEGCLTLYQAINAT